MQGNFYTRIHFPLAYVPTVSKRKYWECRIVLLNVFIQAWMSESGQIYECCGGGRGQAGLPAVYSVVKNIRCFSGGGGSFLFGRSLLLTTTSSPVPATVQTRALQEGGAAETQSCRGRDNLAGQLHRKSCDLGGEGCCKARGPARVNSSPPGRADSRRPSSRLVCLEERVYLAEARNPRGQGACPLPGRGVAHSTVTSLATHP